MSIREQQELREHEYLSKYATFSDMSKGRARAEEECDMRPCFQRDRDRILHCKSFRRLKHKTQVFLAPEGDHYRTRLTHTLEVSQIARSIARALRLNEDLCEAIALGHDIGHTPFGHAGERALNDVCSKGFSHYEQGVRVVEKLEKNGAGLNLCAEVLDGMLNHRTSGCPSTLEGKIVRLSDKIAYINHDIDDGIRSEIIKESDIPKVYTSILGNSTKARLNTLIKDIVINSMDKDDILMSDEVGQAMVSLRKYMFSSLYVNPLAKSEETKVEGMIKELFYFYKEHFELLPELYQNLAKNGGEDYEVCVCDYIAGMTDQYSVSKFEEIYVPKSWKKS